VSPSRPSVLDSSVYDPAKTLFSLTVRDPALRLGPRAGRDGDGWTAGFREPDYPGYVAAAHRFTERPRAMPGPAALLGTVLLNDLVTTAGEVDGQAHLALVTGTSAAATAVPG
jgi:hypothetical protein